MAPKLVSLKKTSAEYGAQTQHARHMYELSFPGSTGELAAIAAASDKPVQKIEAAHASGLRDDIGRVGKRRAEFNGIAYGNMRGTGGDGRRNTSLSRFARSSTAPTKYAPLASEKPARGCI
jgi:hypothetical protein